MKRVVPDEVRQLWGWLMKDKRFEEASFVGDVMKKMENNQQLNLQTVCVLVS